MGKSGVRNAASGKASPGNGKRKWLVSYKIVKCDGTLLFSKCCKAIPNSFVNTVIISMILVHMLIYIYIHIYGLSYIDKVYLNVIISNMRLTNLSLVDVYTPLLLGLWSLPTQMN